MIIQVILTVSLTPALVYGHDIYAYEGDTVNLKCNLTPADSVTWLVPPNLEQYAVGKSVNAKAFPYLKLIRNENSTLILKIFNFTIHKQGQYRCHTKQKKSDINFNVFPAALVYGHAIYAYEGDTVNLTCNLTSKDFVTWLVPPNLQQYAVGKSVNEKAFPDLRLIRNDDSTQILKILNFTIHNQGQYRCQTKKGSINFNVFLAGPLSAPQNIQAIALDTQIIVKWTDNHDIRLQETFFVEYRKHFESQWSRVSAEDKSTAIINGLQPDAVYFLRVYSKNAAGESSKSDIIIVKTEKHNSKVHVLTVVLAMILGVMCLMMVMCWCGIKALKNNQRYRRNQDRGTLQCRNDETFIRPAHYDEIDSMYYNPINSTVSHQAASNNKQSYSRQPLNVPLEDSELKSMSSRNVHCAVHQFKHSEEDHSMRSSSDESYLVPCRNYIDLDIVKVPENEQQNISIEETEVNVEKSSTSSNNSETNIKFIRKYETLNVSGINEHYYKKYNEIDVSSVLKIES